MKRTSLTTFAAVFMMTATLCFGINGQSMHHGGMKGHHMMNENDTTGPMGRCMKAGGCMNGGMMGMKMMMPRQIVPVDDGIIVLIGNKLVKYDKKLNKKKEVVCEIDTDAMMRQMEKFHSTCRKMHTDKDKSDKDNE